MCFIMEAVSIAHVVKGIFGSSYPMGESTQDITFFAPDASLWKGTA